jgi:glutamyl-Q tRNA(Asp) synthetase
MSAKPFSRSLSLIEKWISELMPKSAPAAPAAVSKAAAAAPAAAAAAPAAAAAADAGGEDGGSAISKMNFVVGRVLQVAPHPDSDTLYVESIDVGESTGPRTIVSGLRAHVSVEEFTGKNVLVIANLEPRKLRGVMSAGMVLCASTDGKGKVMLVDVPDAAKAGERIVFPGHPGAAEPVLKKKLAKLWDDVAPLLATDANGVACLAGMPFVTSAGPCTCKALPNAHVS